MKDKLRFEDKDGDFINLTEDDNRNFDEMLLQAKFIEERKVRKILLKVSELDSPLPGKPSERRRKIDKVERVNLKPRTLKFVSNLKSTKHMDTTDPAEVCSEDNESPMENDGIEEDVVSTVGTSTSAVERYIEIALN